MPTRNKQFPKMAVKTYKTVKRKKTTYYYYVDVVRYTDDKGNVKYKRPHIKLGESLAEAKKKYLQIEQKKTISQKGTLNELADIYVKDHLPKKSQGTQELHQYNLIRLRKVFGNVLLENIKPSDIAYYLDNHPLPPSANRELNCMSVMLGLAVRWGWVDSNPCKEVKKLEESGSDYYLPDEEFHTVTEKAFELDPTLFDMISIAYLTALRGVDIRNIRLSRPNKEIAQALKDKSNISFAWITDEGLFVESIKTKSKQFFTFNDELKFAIDRAKARRNKIAIISPWLFLNNKGNQWTRTGFKSRWDRFTKKVGMQHVNFGHLRSKSATDAAEQGKDYQSLLGHTSKKMSDHYVKKRLTTKVEPMTIGEKKEA